MFNDYLNESPNNLPIIKLETGDECNQNNHYTCEKNQILQDIKNHFFKFEYNEAISYLDYKLPNFLNDNIHIKIIILKLIVFYLLSTNKENQLIAEIYLNYLSYLKFLYRIPDLNEININKIIKNPEIVHTRHFQIKLNEIIRLMLIEIDKLLTSNVYSLLNNHLFILSKFDLIDVEIITQYEQDMLIKHNKKKNKDILMQINNSNKIFSNNLAINENSLQAKKITQFAIKKGMKKKMPFVKDFNMKFTKRENIDKKIVRKFRKFVKDKNKKGLLFWDTFGISYYEKNFWLIFISNNMLPPMKYKDDYDEIEFKSFNTKYVQWLLSHNGFVYLYKYFINEKFDEVLLMFTIAYKNINNDEFEQLKYYIRCFPQIIYAMKINSCNKEITEEDEIETSKSGSFSVNNSDSSKTKINERKEQENFDIFCYNNYE